MVVGSSRCRYPDRGDTSATVGAEPTTTYPARATVAILYPGKPTCTGFLIGPSTVITAGSCVAGQRSWRDPARFRVVAGKNGAVEPYGSCGATSIATVVGWYEYLRPTYNYGSISLDCTIGNTVGWYGYFWTSQYGMNNIPITINGYPSDVFPGTQFKSVGRSTVTDDQRVYYTIPVVGQPGSPVWTAITRASCTPCVLGIHGYDGPPAYNQSSGVKINRSVFRNLWFWKYGSYPPS